MLEIVKNQVRYYFAVPSEGVNSTLLKSIKEMAKDILGSASIGMYEAGDYDIIEDGKSKLGMSPGDYYLYMSPGDKDKWIWSYEDIFKVKQRIEKQLNTKGIVEMTKNTLTLPDISEEYESLSENALISKEEVADRLIKKKILANLGIVMTDLSDPIFEDPDVLTTMIMVQREELSPMDWWIDYLKSKRTVYEKAKNKNEKLGTTGA